MRIDSGQLSIQSGEATRLDRLQRPGDTQAGSPSDSFRSELGKAIGEIDNLQTAADAQADAVAHGAGNLHEMALALEKADVAMRLAMRIRNKLVDTYNDIMKMGM